MSNEIKANTDGERLIQLDGKVDKLDGKVDTVIKALENAVLGFERLETTRISKLEQRINDLERWKNEFSGGYKFFIILSLILGTVSTVLIIAKWVTK